MADRQTKVSLSVQMQQYIDGMNKAAKATRDTGKEAEKLAQQREAFDRLGKASLTAGAVIAAGLTVSIAKFVEFDQAMSNVASTGEDARGSLSALRQAALDAGASTVFSATESANAIEELAKAGLDASDILGGALTGSLDLAAAGGLGVARAAEIAATTLQQFGLEGSDATHVADLLAAGAGKAMGDVEDMSQALNQAGLVANQFGVSVEETTGTLAAFASAGMLGSDAGTSFRTMLLRLANPTEEVKNLMKEIGFEAYDASGQFIGMSALAGELESSLRGMTDEQKQTTLAMIFGQDAIRGATVLYEQGAAGIEEWTEKVDDAGYAAETAAIKLDNLAGDWEALTGAVDTALISMGAAADGPLRFFVQALTEIVDGFNDLPEPAKQAVFWVGAVAGAGGLALGSYLLLVPKIAEFNEALGILGPRAQTAARNVGRLAAIGGGALAGIAVGAVALDAITQALKDIGPEAEVVANKVVSARNAVDLLSASAGKFGGSGIELATKQLAALGDVLDRGGPSSTADIIGNSTITNIQLLGKELAKVAESDLPTAQKQFRLLAESAELSDKQQALLLDRMPEFKSALTEQATAAGVAADAQGLIDLALGDSEDTTKENEDAMRALAGQAAATGDEVDGLADQIRNFGSATLDVRDAERQFQQALDDLSESIANNGSSLDTNTQEGRDNQAALDDLATSTLEYSAATQTRTGSEEEAARVLGEGRQRLIEMLGQFGITGDAAEAYADELGLIPENIDTYVTAHTQDASNAIQAWLNRWNNMNVNFRANVLGLPASVPVGTGTVLKPDGRASGGAVYGPGTGTSDTAGLYALSNGEHVLTAADVAAMGGQHAVYAYREGLHNGRGSSPSSTGPTSVSLAGATLTMFVDGVPMRAVIQEQIVTASAESNQRDNAGTRRRY